MTAALIDADGISTIAAAEAQAALAVGDTLRAKEKYAAAGRSLEADAARVQTEEDKHLALFLAATQYFKGGYYQKAVDLGQVVRSRELPTSMQPLLLQFRRDAKERAAPDYQTRVLQNLRDLWANKDLARILEVLQEHPYILPPGPMAFLRAVACESLGNYQAAAIFYADAVARTPQDPGLLFIAAVLPLTLPRQGKLQEAWEYARHQVDRIPHPVTYVVASLLCFHRAEVETGPARNALIEEQLALLEKAVSRYATLPEAQQKRIETRTLIALGFEAGAISLSRLDDPARTRAICDRALAFAPSNPHLWTVRAIVTYPDPSAIADFTKAIDLGDETWYPCYYLAHQALLESDFHTGLFQVGEAIKRGQKQSPAIKAQLYGWMAICQASLGAVREDVEATFQIALQLDSANQEVRHNHQLFLAQADEPVTIPPWERAQPGDMERLMVFDREARFLESFRDPASFHSGLNNGDAILSAQGMTLHWLAPPGDRPQPLFAHARLTNFKISWAGPFASGFCFGSVDGRLLLTDDAGRRLRDPLTPSASRTAINGVAQQEDWIAVTTRQEINLWPLPGAEKGDAKGIMIPHHGANGILATASGHFVAPLGKAGLLMASPGSGASAPVVFCGEPEGSPDLERMIAAGATGSNEVLVCAMRRDGIGALEFSGSEANHTLNTVTVSNLDVVDVCALNPGMGSSAVAALGSDGSLALFRDALQDRKPITIKFSAVKGVAYRLLSCRGHLFLLTSQGLYVLANLAGRFVRGQELCDGGATLVLSLPMEAVDANLCGDQWLLVVMPDEVRRYDIGLIHESIPRSISHGEAQQFDSAEVREVLPRRLSTQIRQRSRRLVAGAG